MKFFKIINLTLLFLFSCSLANAKPLPPGTGNAVPSNILFLVDRSQSMNTSSSGRVANKMRRPPVDVVGRGGGIYYLSTKAEGGFLLLTQMQILRQIVAFVTNKELMDIKMQLVDLLLD